MSRPLRVVVVDDHPMFRNGMRAQLDRDPATELVGEAATGNEAISLVGRTRPDVVLMDLQLPDVDGVAATRAIVDRHPEIGVVVLTMFDDDRSVYAALRAGARGYLLKGSTGAEISRAIAAVGSGEAILGASIGARLSDFITMPSVAHEAFPELTDRERDVLDLLAAGWSNHEIAEHFVLSVKTIRNHVSNIFTKLQVADRRAAIATARDAGMGRDPGGPSTARVAGHRRARM